MASIRRELGEDAIIVATSDAPGGGVQVRAASDQPMGGDVMEAPRERAERIHSEIVRQRGDDADGIDRIIRALGFHRVPDSAIEALARFCEMQEDGPAAHLLAQGMESRYRFAPIEGQPGEVLLFAGAPGSGKTATLARVAARAAAHGVPALLIATDCERAGAEARITELAEKLCLPHALADDPRDAEALVQAAGDQLVLIDAPAANPFDLDDLDMTAAFAAAAEAEIIAVIEAGTSPDDAFEAASLMASIGACRTLITKADCARRKGAMLAAGEAGLAYAHLSASPYIGAGLAPATPLRFARTLLDLQDLPEDAMLEGDEA
ncbi:flagellar biosynthesis-like protein (FlhF) [Hyphobacterium sp. HN65]|uniref:Flagellar biosynthesis-like protein (FlhF) n=1 Tax=Hyphobacterium lacteum TaxID=3116575 RepID=A0ABU7LQB2_9PROT|nr:flagellar biosynthesis-like protein (FlhF) [Hyphobacterium sp. HN65]MEE2526106.1 flagellar biosynthesis-like protein (FlhF) [Hyphobacterium sp. HN65]